MSGILIVGAGGHAKVVADILLCQGLAVLGYVDDDPSSWGEQRLGLPVLGGIDRWTEHTPDGLVMGVGGNAARQAIVRRLGEAAADMWRNAVHPSATVAPSVRLGVGVVIAAQAALNPDTVVGDHVIINTGATVDHDCILGEYSHIAPGAHLAGGVQVGAGTLVGVGVSVIPYQTIGSWSTIGAGATVVREIPGHVTAYGVPARWNTSADDE